MKTNRLLMLAAILLVLAMLAAAGWTIAARGGSTELPIHWDLHGQPDNYAPAWIALLAMPLMVVLMSALIIGLPFLEPRRDNLARSANLYLAVWAGLLIVLGAADIAILGAAWKWPIDTIRLVAGAIGIMLMLLGDQLAKSRSMFTVGIRTPWTLANEDVWIATHRLGGKLFMLCGAIWLIVAATGVPMDRAFPRMLALLLGAVGVAVIYSWWLWRKLGKARG